jgi:predicted transglutaminase-like cysteine proteinase
MASLVRARVVVRLLTAACLALAVGSPDALAKTKNNAPGEGLDAIDLPIGGPMLQASRQGPARFFSINQVLARRDRRPAGSGFRIAAVQAAAFASDGGTALKAAAPRGPEPFGLFSFRAPQGVLWSKWQGLQADMRREAAVLDACRGEAETCSEEARRFEMLVGAARAQQGRQRLAAVSHRVNAMLRYTTDYVQHGVPDLWSAPLATLRSGLGDCEDYAILKYSVLRAAGVAEQDLRVVLLRDAASGQDHAILAARDQDRWFLLDNLGSGFYADDERPSYRPLFALDAEGVKLFAVPYAMRMHHESEMAPAAAEDAAAGSPSPLAYLL